MTRRDAGPWSSRRLVITGLIGVMTFFAGVGVWATRAEIASAVVLPGQLEVERNRQVVQHPTGGVVAALMVADGSLVSAGDVLLRLDAADLRAELDLVTHRQDTARVALDRIAAEQAGASEVVFDAEIMARAATEGAVAALLEDEIALFRARRQTRDVRIASAAERRDSFEAVRAGFAAAGAAVQAQLAHHRRQLKDVQSLQQKGLASDATVLTLQKQEQALIVQLGEYRAQLSQTQEALQAFVGAERLTRLAEEETLAATATKHAQALTELAIRAQVLRRQIDANVLRAPVSGVIYGSTLHAAGAILRAAEPALFIVPQDRPLVVAVQVAPGQIASVSVGQEVRLRFGALDRGDPPELTGQVARVSADVIASGNGVAPFYKVEITLPGAEVASLSAGQRLLPGMPVEAFILTGERTALTYLLQPFTDYFRRAFRES